MHWIFKREHLSCRRNVENPILLVVVFMNKSISYITPNIGKTEKQQHSATLCLIKYTGIIKYFLAKNANGILYLISRVYCVFFYWRTYFKLPLMNKPLQSTKLSFHLCFIIYRSPLRKGIHLSKSKFSRWGKRKFVWIIIEYYYGTLLWLKE